MPRFFLPRPLPEDGRLLLSGENAVHAKVLRLRPGEAVTVCDGAGTDYRCAVEEASAEQMTLRVLEMGPSVGEPRVEILLFAAFSKSDRFEHVIQKGTELGAAGVIAFPSSRCISRPEGASLAKRLERWRKIAASAAEQSGRGRIPGISAAPSFEAALQQASTQERAIFLYEEEKDVSFRAALAAGPFQTAAIVTGPEGGFEPEEAALARELGLPVCTLGPRILRCETAPLCALSAMLFVCGELEQKH